MEPVLSVSRRQSLRRLAIAGTVPWSALAADRKPPAIRLVILDVGGTIIEDRGDVPEALIGAMAFGFLATLALPVTRAFFGLEMPRPLVWFAAFGLVCLAGFALELGWRAAGWVREHVEPRSPPRT